ncbi:MAG: NfeD family protein [Bacilli bacterium]|nr:NfeD family protein [Bacilli bacterium]
MGGFEDYIVYVWLAVFVVTFIIEALTVDLISIWFSAAALICLVLSFIPNFPFWGEIIVFFVTSIAMIFGLKPIASKHLQRKVTKSNIDEIVGKKGIIIKEITPLHYGEVKINDIIWSALSVEEEGSIPNDTPVEVVAVKGNKLIVQKHQFKNK